MIPKIDPDVKYIGSSKLRDLTAVELRALTGAIVVTGAQNTPLVVILPYETYLKMQQAIEAAGKFETRFWEGQPFPILAAEEVAEEFKQGIFQSDSDGFDEKRNEVRSGIERGARRTPPRTMRQKGDGKR